MKFNKVLDPQRPGGGFQENFGDLQQKNAYSTVMSKLPISFYTRDKYVARLG